MPTKHPQARAITVVATVAFVWSLTLTATAQRLVATVYGAGAPGSGSPNVVVVHNLATGQTELSRPGTGGGVITADGRYVLVSRRPSSSPTILELYDTATRAISRLSLVVEPAMAHPRELAVFGLDNGLGGMARADAGGVRPLPVCGPDLAVGFDLTLDGSAVVAACGNPFVVANARVVVADASTGQLRRTADLGPVPPRAIAANHDGSRVLAVRALSSNAFEVLLVDTVANQVTVLFVDSPFPTGPAAGGCAVVGTTRARDRVAVRCQWTNFATAVERTELVAFDTGQRRVLASVPSASTMHFSPDGATAIVSTGDRLQLLDVVADRLIGQFTVSNGIGDVAYPPAAPSGVTATVSGSRVQLTWMLPPGSPVVTGYVLEAGTAPGLRDIGTVTLGPVGGLDIPSVPPGRYFLRLQAQNFTGTGAASNEVVVVVP